MRLLPEGFESSQFDSGARHRTAVGRFERSSSVARNGVSDIDADRIVGHELLTNRKRLRRFEDQWAKVIYTMS